MWPYRPEKGATIKNKKKKWNIKPQFIQIGALTTGYPAYRTSVSSPVAESMMKPRTVMSCGMRG